MRHSLPPTVVGKLDHRRPVAIILPHLASTGFLFMVSVYTISTPGSVPFPDAN
jgi:hypothetical protein